MAYRRAAFFVHNNTLKYLLKQKKYAYTQTMDKLTIHTFEHNPHKHKRNLIYQEYL